MNIEVRKYTYNIKEMLNKKLLKGKLSLESYNFLSSCFCGNFWIIEKKELCEHFENELSEIIEFQGSNIENDLKENEFKCFLKYPFQKDDYIDYDYIKTDYCFICGEKLNINILETIDISNALFDKMLPIISQKTNILKKQRELNFIINDFKRELEKE